MKKLLACFALLIATGCVPTDQRAQLALETAANELDCAKSALSVRFLGNRLFRVSGCGRRATYRVICKLTVGSCELLGGPEAPIAAAVDPKDANLKRPASAAKAP